MLTIFREFQHPVLLITKSCLDEHDIDLLAELSAIQPCSVSVFVTTLDASLKGILEPRDPGTQGSWNPLLRQVVLSSKRLENWLILLFR